MQSQYAKKDLMFEIYQSPGDSLFYWRLWLNSYISPDDRFIIATGHQGYKDKTTALFDINYVIAANEKTTIIDNT
jgi:hypothetical protein